MHVGNCSQQIDIDGLAIIVQCLIRKLTCKGVNVCALHKDAKDGTVHTGITADSLAAVRPSRDLTATKGYQLDPFVPPYAYGTKYFF